MDDNKRTANRGTNDNDSQFFATYHATFTTPILAPCNAGHPKRTRILAIHSKIIA